MRPTPPRLFAGGNSPIVRGAHSDNEAEMGDAKKGSTRRLQTAKKADKESIRAKKASTRRNTPRPLPRDKREGRDDSSSRSKRSMSFLTVIPPA